MYAYLKFFELERSPFDAKAHARVILGTRAIRDAFAAIESGIAEGASRICVNGGPGMGKTSLARALPKLLGDKARVALVPDPALSWESSRTTLARQWGIESSGLARTALIEAATERPLVLVIDQAEKADEDFLDHLDVILSYRSESETPVVQSVLLARLGGETESDAPNEGPRPLIWWLDRIQTLQLEFAPLPRDGVQPYIHKHLKRAGWQGPELFSADAALAIHEYAGGVPGEISALCESMLIEAAAQNLSEIDAGFVRGVFETEPISEITPATDDITNTEKNETISLTAETEPQLATGEKDEGCAAPGAYAEPPQASLDDAQREIDQVAPIELISEITSPDTANETQGNAPWTLPDEFEALAMEEEFPADASDQEINDASEECETDSQELTSLEQALEHFGEAAANALEDAWAEDDGVDPLLAPPTPEEWAEIQGSVVSRFMRPLAVAAAAIVLVGFGIAQFSSDDALTSSSKSEQSRRTQAARSNAKAAAPRTASAGTISIPDLTPQSGEGTPQLVLFEPAGGFLSADSLPKAKSVPGTKDLGDTEGESFATKPVIAAPAPEDADALALHPSQDKTPEADSMPAAPDF